VLTVLESAARVVKYQWHGVESTGVEAEVDVGGEAIVEAEAEVEADAELEAEAFCAIVGESAVVKPSRDS
jgi:hypothetical protein